MSRTRSFASALSIGVVLAVITLGLGFFEGGQEGVCWGESDFYREHLDAAAAWRSEYSLWPPGQACFALSKDGSVLSERTYPELQDWVLALVLLGAPFAVWGGWRLRRRRSAAGSPVSPRS